MRRITSRLTKPLAVLAIAALVGMGGGVAYADDTPTPPTSSTASNTSESSTESTADSTAQQPVEKDKAEKPAADTAVKDKVATDTAPAEKPAAPASKSTPPKYGTLYVLCQKVGADPGWKIDVSQNNDANNKNRFLLDTTTGISPQEARAKYSASQCTKFNPPPITKVNKPEAPATVDPCNPAGVTNNVAWKDELPADTDQVNWTENAAGTVRTAALKDTATTTWSDGSVAPLTFTLPADSGEACEVPITKVDIQPVWNVTEVCNVSDDSLPNDTATATETAQYTTKVGPWAQLDGGYVLPIVFTAKEGLTFTGTNFSGGTVSEDGKTFTVLVYDNYTECTTPITKVNKPEAPATVDPCNPAGVTNNVAWKDELPADTDQVNWTENAAGTVRTAALKDTATTTWSDGSVAPLTFTLPADSGEACEGPGATEVPVPTQAQTDPCNPEGVTFNASWNGLLPADTDQIDWSESSDGKVRTATLKSTTEAPLKWSDGSTEPKVFTLTESGKACEVTPVVVTPVAPKVTPLCDTTDLVELADQPVGVVLVDAGQWVKQSDGTYKRVVKYAAAKGYTLPEGNDGTFTLTDNGEACEVPVVIAPKGSLTLTCDGGSAVLDNSASNAEVGYEIVVVFTDGNVWYFPMVLVGGETATIDLPALPAGTKVFLNAADTDLASVTAPSNCTKPEKPNKPTQPNKPEKPSKPVFNTGVDTPAAVAAVPTYGSPFNLTASGIAFAAVLFLAWVIQVLRTRRIAPMFFRR